MEYECRRAWVDVDLDALLSNARTVATRARLPLLPMIKADAYGLGAVPVAHALERVDPWGFGIAALAEGEELRRAGIRRRTVVFTPLLPDEFKRARAADITPTLGGAAALAAWIESGGGTWHLAIDTGMNRAGVPDGEIGAMRDGICAEPPEGAFTHFHSADENNGSLDEQQRRFRDVLGSLPERPAFVHAENSPALERQSPSPWDLVRPGVFLYGVGGGAGSQVAPLPVAHLRARVVELRDVPNGATVSYGATWRATGRRRIATVNAGYADGYRRSLSNVGQALIHGQRVGVAGRVTMDMTMFDVTDVPCSIGDVVTLIGRDGDALMDVNEVARRADLSPYEVLTGLKLRAERIYHGGQA